MYSFPIFDNYDILFHGTASFIVASWRHMASDIFVDIGLGNRLLADDTNGPFY